MKVQNVNEISAVQATANTGSVKRTPEDKVSLQRTEELKATIEQARQGAGMARAAQLQALEAAIRNGTFRPSPQQVAEKILQAAEVDARLRALLK